MTEPPAAQTDRHSLALGRVLGVVIRLDLSVLIIFALIVFSLAGGVFPRWHPQWSAATHWLTAMAAGIAFFASLLAHELSHAVVARHHGVPVPRITLFLFGGIAEAGKEPDHPRDEFLIAIAGPAMSLLISVLCTSAALRLTGNPELLAELGAGRVEVMSGVGPVATALLWLGSVNLVLAVFNMVPGFPMDGGRVFRAVLWAVTGDKRRATRWAANGGRYFGWLLMGLGVASLLGGGGPGGLWWIVLGWFISSLAAMSYRNMLSDSVLRGHRVADLMRTHFEQVPPEMPLARFTDDYLLRSHQQLWPVVRDEDLLGVISIAELRPLSPAARAGMSVREAMRPLADTAVLDPRTSAGEAFADLGRHMDQPLPVVANGRILGLIGHADIVRWLSLHE